MGLDATPPRRPRAPVAFRALRRLEQRAEVGTLADAVTQLVRQTVVHLGRRRDACNTVRLDKAQLGARELLPGRVCLDSVGCGGEAGQVKEDRVGGLIKWGHVNQVYAAGGVDVRIPHEARRQDDLTGLALGFTAARVEMIGGKGLKKSEQLCALARQVWIV